MTQVVDKARAYKQAMTDARGEEIARERSQTLPGAVGSTAIAQALHHPGRALDVMRQFWDSSDLPGPVKALLGVTQLGLAGINDLSHLDEESSRSVVGSMAYALSYLPGNDHVWAEGVQSAFERTPGGFYEKSRAANEAFAKGHEVEAGIANAVFSPSNLLTLGGGGLAKLGVKSGSPLLAKLATGALRTGEASDAIQGLPIKAITYPLGKAVQGGRYALGGQATKAKIAEQLASEMVAGKLVRARPGLLGQPRGVQAALPGVTDVPGEVLASGPRGAVQQALPLGQAPPVNMAPGGRVPPAPASGHLSDVTRLLFDDAPDATVPSADVLGLRPGPVRVGPTHADIAKGRRLEDLIRGDPQRIARLRRAFPALDEDALVSTLLQGQKNAPARTFARLVQPNWGRAQAGQLTEDDVINAYIPAILSQQRGAVQPDSTFMYKLTGDPRTGTKAHPLANAALASFESNKVLPLNKSFGLEAQGEMVGGYRPEDMAAYLLNNTPEGQELFHLLKQGTNAAAIRQAAVRFGAIFPQSTFFTGKGNELESVVKAGTDRRFALVADMINQKAMAGETPEMIADPLRAGGVLPRINEGKGGFVVNNLGGPAGTFDKRAKKTMFVKGDLDPLTGQPHPQDASVHDYVQGLKDFWPDMSSGEAHHALWDAQGFARTRHLEIARAVKKIAQQFQPNTSFPSHIVPGIAQLATDARLGERAPKSDVPFSPPWGYEQMQRNKYQQEFLNDPARVAQNKVIHTEDALKAYLTKTGTRQNFDQFWQRLNDWVAQTLTVSMGIGDAASADAIIKSGMPLSNGMARWGVRPGQEDFPEGIVKAKARALGIDKPGSARNLEAIRKAAEVGITDTQEAIDWYSKFFLRTEGGSFDKIGLGDPTVDPDTIHGMYASVTESQPALNQMGGGIHIIVDPYQTPYTGTLHHPFAMESPSVLDMHKGTPNALKEGWTPAGQAALAERAGRGPTARIGPEGDWSISESPQLTGPMGMVSLRAAALVMSDGGDILKLAVTDPERAAALMVRSTPGKARGLSQEKATAQIAKAAAKGKNIDPALGVGYNLAINPSLKRSEAMVHELRPEYVTGIVVKGNNEATVVANAQAAQRFMDHFGIDAPIYIAYGPPGNPNPGLYRLTDQGPVYATLNQGRQRLIETIKGMGEANYGVTPGLAQAVEPEVRDANLAKFMDGAHPALLDEHGFPKVFYHGTSAGDFTQFADPERPGAWGRGIYLTEEPSLANLYAGDALDPQAPPHSGNDNFVPRGEAGPNVKPVYVNLKNPLIVADDPSFQMVGKREMRAEAERLGHDGIIVTGNVFGGRNSYFRNDTIEEMVVFDPAAIKSASGNVGTFDPADPSLLKVAPQAQPQYAVQQRGQNPLQWLRTPVANYGGLVNTRLSTMGGAGLLGAGVGGLQPADSNEQRLEHAQQGAVIGAGLGGAGTSRRAFNVIQHSGTVGTLSKELLKEALVAQHAAMGRKSKGLGMLREIPAVWKVQATSTLRNLLQDEATARLWLSDAGVRTQMMNDNWASLVKLYNQGQRDPYLALPEDTTQLLDALGLHGYVPDVGASFMETNKGLIDTLSAGDTALLEGGLAMVNPLQGGIPIAGAALGAVKGYTRAGQQKLFDQLNQFTRTASRHAAFQDTLEKTLPGVADRFVKAHGLQQLAGKQGIFTAADVDALVPGLGPLWQKNLDVVIDGAEKRAKDILGDYQKEAFRGEKQIGKILPFTSYAFRAYPRTAKMMLHHPGASLAIMMLMAKGANAAGQQDLPGYLAGTVPMDTDTPVAGGVVRAMAGGQDATGYANPLALLSPVGGALIGGDDLPEDANLYQKTASGLGRLGFGFNPLIEAGAVALNKDYRLPSAPSRTAAIEQALPGPQLPSLAQGPINFLRQQAGGSPLETTALDRRIGQVFYEATGMALNDPAVQANPQLAALAASTLDPASPIVQEARARELQSGVARTTVGMASPVSVSARTDIQRVQDRARGAAKDLPPAAYDPAEVRKLEQSSNFSDQLQAMLQARANRGTQATPPPEAGITSGVSRQARAYAALDAWRRQNVGLAQIAPSVYRQQEQQLRELLGIQ